jgi:ATP-dependent DNA helicase RecQ
MIGEDKPGTIEPTNLHDLPPSSLPTMPEFETGMRVRVPKFDIGTVLSTAGDHVVIDFAEHGTHTFVADHVSLA